MVRYSSRACPRASGPTSGPDAHCPYPMSRPMLIQITCPHCGVNGRLRDDGQGHRVLCPRCGMRFDLPARPEPEPELDSAPPASVIDSRGGEAEDVDTFGNPAHSGYYESPTIDADH